MTPEQHQRPHMQSVANPNGLEVFPSVKSTHRLPGTAELAHINVQESSALDPSIWIGVKSDIGLDDDGTVLGPYGSGDTVELSVHLSREAAVQLAEQILALAERIKR